MQLFPDFFPFSPPHRTPAHIVYNQHFNPFLKSNVCPFFVHKRFNNARKKCLNQQIGEFMSVALRGWSEEK